MNNISVSLERRCICFRIPIPQILSSLFRSSPLFTTLCASLPYTASYSTRVYSSVHTHAPTPSLSLPYNLHTLIQKLTVNLILTRFLFPFLYTPSPLKFPSLLFSLFTPPPTSSSFSLSSSSLLTRRLAAPAPAPAARTRSTMYRYPSNMM